MSGDNLALYFLDTSALVKLYVQEPGTDLLLPLVARHPENRFAVLSIAQVEFRSAIRRRQRAGDIGAADATAILDSLRAHLETQLMKQVVNEAVVDEALQLIDRHPLRAYDALQLAGCIVLSSISADNYIFVCSDHALLEAAESEQLRVFDPAA